MAFVLDLIYKACYHCVVRLYFVAYLCNFKLRFIRTNRVVLSKWYTERTTSQKWIKIVPQSVLHCDDWLEHYENFIVHLFVAF